MVASYSDIQDALLFIPANLSRDHWWKVCAAIKNELGDAGFDFFDSWSQAADNYSVNDVRATWKSTKDSGGIKVGTLFKTAQDYGYKAPTTTHKPVTKHTVVKCKNKPVGAAQRYWDQAEDCPNHPYAEAKGLDTIGLKKYKGRLLIPAYNADGEMSSMQELSKDGSKKFLAGCKMAGCWYTIKGDEVIVVAEGWATAKSIHLATGHTCIVVFSSGGFMKVPPLLRQQNPQARIILAPDNDESQDAVKKATKAARDSGCEIIVPEVEEGSDFDDVRQTAGLEEIRRQFAQNVKIPRQHELVIVNAADVVPEKVEWFTK